MCVSEFDRIVELNVHPRQIDEIFRGEFIFATLSQVFNELNAGRRALVFVLIELR